MIHLDRQQILNRADPAGLIAAIERAFAEPATLPERMQCDLPGGDGAKLLLMPAWHERESIGVKLITVMPDNPKQKRPTIGGLYILMDGRTGEIRALLDGAALTAVRTAAVSALAANLMARPDARCLLMIGTGALAPHLIRFHAAVRPITRVTVWGRDRARASTTAVTIPPGIEAVTVNSLDRAVRQADIISSATAATEPLIRGRLLRPGTHIDLVGSFTSTMRESDDDVMARAIIAVDDRSGLAKSGDLLGPLTAGLIVQNEVISLGELCRGIALRPRPACDITVFKAVGTGLADLAAATFLVAAC